MATIPSLLCAVSCHGTRTNGHSHAAFRHELAMIEHCSASMRESLQGLRGKTPLIPRTGHHGDADSLGNSYSSFACLPSLASLVVIRACHFSSSKCCRFGGGQSLVLPFGL